MSLPDALIVSAADVTRVYGEGEAAVHALDGVTVDFPKGRFTAIMGPSGSGKSTLMHILAGLDRPTSGSVVLDGVEITTLDDRRLTELRRERVGFVFQSFNLLPVLDARENIVLPLSIAGKRPDREWLERLIDTVGLRDRLDHRPSELSGGQQQRVAVARALASKPAVVFADEPRSPPARCSTSFAAPTTSSARRSSWSRTTRPPPPTPTACSSSRTAGSSTTRRRPTAPRTSSTS